MATWRRRGRGARCSAIVEPHPVRQTEGCRWSARRGPAPPPRPGDRPGRGGRRPWRPRGRTGSDHGGRQRSGSRFGGDSPGGGKRIRRPTLCQVMTAAAAPTRLWTPSRVLVTRSAAALPHGRPVLERVQAAGVPDVRVLAGDRLPNLRGDGDRAAFMAAKQTLAVVGVPPRSGSCSRSRRPRTGASTSPRAAPRTASTATSRARCPGRRSPGSSPTCPRSSPGSTGTSATARSPRAPRARPRGDDVRGVLLHRPAGDRAPHRRPGHGDHPLRHPRLARSGAAAGDHQVRRRRGPAGPAARRPHPAALLGQRRLRRRAASRAPPPPCPPGSPPWAGSPRPATRWG